MTEAKTKQEKGHLVTACKAIQREIDKKELAIARLNAKSEIALKEAMELRNEIVGLSEQISKLKGNG